MYYVPRTIKHDDGRVFEAGVNALADATPEEIAEWLAIGWATPDAPETDPANAPEPLALPHFEGQGDAPPGTWEYVRQQAVEPVNSGDAPRPRRRKSED